MKPQHPATADGTHTTLNPTTLLQPQAWDFPQEDQYILRDLAAKVAHLARQPVEATKRDRWQLHNRLEPTRPLIFCDPENSWHEIIPDDALRCQNEIARSWELYLRKQIFWGEQMGDDYTIQPYFPVSHVHSTPNWGLMEQRIGGEHGGAYIWDSPLRDVADLEKLHFPTINIDYHATEQLAQLAEAIFGDLLPVRIKTLWWWTLGMTWTLANLRGLEQIMYDMVDNPDFLHQIMSVLRDGTMTMINDLEATDLLSLNSDGTYVGSGALGWTDELPQPDFDGHVRLQDMWGFAESQETVSISPRMFNEFVLPYQKPILERFGLTCYGCCEPLDNRWKYVKTIPNLRRVSVSPWANREFMAQQLEDRYIFSMKPNPANLAFDDFDEARIRDILRHDLEVSRGCHVEIVLKDTHT
ncbi:MAG: hypothetical protein K8L99_03565, partial [Anaerolineae bacterium]|nr:hypothetical protein [Anaerolineae bacterium]